MYSRKVPQNRTKERKSLTPKNRKSIVHNTTKETYFQMFNQEIDSDNQRHKSSTHRKSHDDDLERHLYDRYNGHPKDTADPDEDRCNGRHRRPQRRPRTTGSSAPNGESRPGDDDVWNRRPEGDRQPMEMLLSRGRSRPGDRRPSIQQGRIVAPIQSPWTNKMSMTGRIEATSKIVTNEL